jgi:hypothetical protein
LKYKYEKPPDSLQKEYEDIVKKTQVTSSGNVTTSNVTQGPQIPSSLQPQPTKQDDLEILSNTLKARDAEISDLRQKNKDLEGQINLYKNWKISGLVWEDDKYVFQEGGNTVGFTDLKNLIVAPKIKNTNIVNAMAKMKVYQYNDLNNEIVPVTTPLGGLGNKTSYVVISRNDLQNLMRGAGITTTFSASPLLMGNRIEKDLFERLGQQQSGTGEVSITFSDVQGEYLSLTMIRAQLKRRELSGDYWIVNFDRPEVIRYNFHTSQRRDLIEKVGTIEVEISDSDQNTQRERMSYDSVPTSTGRSGTQAIIRNDNLQLYVTDFSSTKFKLDMMIIKS